MAEHLVVPNDGHKLLKGKEKGLQSDFSYTQELLSWAKYAIHRYNFSLQDNSGQYNSPLGFLVSLHGPSVGGMEIIWM